MPEPFGPPGGASPDSSSSSSSSSDSRSPDYFDRLLARHAQGAGPSAGVARVRPRLAGPFERVEAVRGGGHQEADEVGALWPSSQQQAVRGGELMAATREVRFHSERERTLVRTESTPAPEPLTPRAASPALRPDVPLLRPAAAPVPRALPETSRRATARERTTALPSPRAASAPVPPGAEAAAAVVPAPLRPSAVDTAAARDAVRQTAGRRGARGAEQVVQVQIGRLEVTAAGASSGGGGRGQRQAPGRQGATVSLQDYLARGRE